MERTDAQRERLEDAKAFVNRRAGAANALRGPVATARAEQIAAFERMRGMRERRTTETPTKEGQ